MAAGSAQAPPAGPGALPARAGAEAVARGQAQTWQLGELSVPERRRVPSGGGLRAAPR